MLEYLEQLKVPAEQILNNPEIAVAGALAGSIAMEAFVSEAGYIRAEQEIEELDQNEIWERKDDLSDQIERDSFFHETYRRFTNPWTDGKLSAYEEADDEHRNYFPELDDPEYFNQLYTQEMLEDSE